MYVFNNYFILLNIYICIRDGDRPQKKTENGIRKTESFFRKRKTENGKRKVKKDGKNGKRKRGNSKIFNFTEFFENFLFFSQFLKIFTFFLNF